MCEQDGLNESQKKLLRALIESAKKRKTITYGDLAEKSGFAAVGIGKQLEKVGEYLERKGHSAILNSIAVNRNSDIPANGFGRFFCGYKSLSDREKESLVLLLQECAFKYEGWNDVIKELN